MLENSKLKTKANKQIFVTAFCFHKIQVIMKHTVLF